MNIKIGNVEGLMNVCIPYTVVEPVIEKLNTKYWYSTIQVKDDSMYHEIMEQSIAKAKIPIRAILGRSVISVNDFMYLQPGDIIKLDTRVEEDLDVFVGNLKKFSALSGSYQDYNAVKIKKVYREE